MEPKEMQEIAGFLRAAQHRLQLSVATSRALLTAEFAGPSFAWSVRSVEIFLKYFVLTPLYYQPGSGESGWTKAVKKASNRFGSSNWSGAMKEVEKTCGPLDPMLTEDGVDAYTYWRRRPVVYRGTIVHGEHEGDREAAQAVLGYAEQMILQLKLRLLTSGKHPFSDVFKEQLRRVWDQPSDATSEPSNAD